MLRLSDAARLTRDELIDRLAAAGIGTSVHYVPLHRRPYWRGRYGLRPEQFPVADRAYQRMFNIPLFTAMSDDEKTDARDRGAPGPRASMSDPAPGVHAARARDGRKPTMDVALCLLALPLALPLMALIALAVGLVRPGRRCFGSPAWGAAGGRFASTSSAPCACTMAAGRS